MPSKEAEPGLGFQAQLKLVVAGMAAAGLSMRQAEKLWHEALSVWPDEAEDTIIESGDEGTSDWRVPKFEFVTPTKKGGSKNGTPNKKRVEPIALDVGSGSKKKRRNA
ncbi:hypothetical protein GQ607_017869 [Colletotrichum asianum]|uniref:Uncharacterized protein n=1 Tax=Colletotrichum asianum TaxID=702518 RepID=A0A8H3ZIQ1_9PEZI|nr:hypothetical protein GQ607_017869 [Colletotrichum asianum]